MKILGQPCLLERCDVARSWMFDGTLGKADWQVLLKKLIKNIKTVVVADGSGNQDKEAIANESWVASNVLFSKNGHREKAKPGKEMTCPGCIRI